ncbi:hypothetical protein ACWD1Z_34130 [Streptomyces sp. NPDC002784]
MPLSSCCQSSSATRTTLLAAAFSGQRLHHAREDLLEVTAVPQDEAAAVEGVGGEGVVTAQGTQRVAYGGIELGPGQYGQFGQLPYGRVDGRLGRALGAGPDGIAHDDVMPGQAFRAVDLSQGPPLGEGGDR